MEGQARLSQARPWRPHKALGWETVQLGTTRITVYKDPSEWVREMVGLRQKSPESRCRSLGERRSVHAVSMAVGTEDRAIQRWMHRDWPDVVGGGVQD